MKHFAGLIAYASLVYGHGYVTNATIGSDSYEFYQPYTDPYTSPAPERVSRPIQGNGPVTDVTIADIQCGGYSEGGIVGSSPANLTAGPVEAGSSVDLYWTLWPESHVGPTLTYMARCANDDCTTFMPESDAVWFKVQEDGREGTSDTWGATAVMTAGGSVSYTIPECLEPGSYLVRHEIIALHAAYSEGGAQFYPGCHQVEVTGSGSTAPTDLVAFPGAYAADDAGILYDPYKATEYTLPGPALFSCSGSSSSSGSSSGSGSGSSSGSGSAPTTGAPQPSSTMATVTRSASATNDAVVAAAAATTPASSSSSEEDDDECEAEVTVTSTVSASQPEETGADDGDDEYCEDEPTTTTTAETAAATGSAASGEDEEDCGAEEEQEYAKRFVGRFARDL